MQTYKRWLELTIAGALAVSLAACEEEKKPAAEKAQAAEPAASVAAATPDPEVLPPPEPEKPSRPEKIDTEVTAERRAAIEKAYPEAKGFVVATEIEDKLKKNKAISAKDAAVTAFDRLAKGKWVLFSGPVSNPADSGFELGITYTPRDPKDLMGMSRQWFPLSLAGVEGYDKEKMKAGTIVVVLAKYEGGAKATKGYELVELGHWGTAE